MYFCKFVCLFLRFLRNSVAYLCVYLNLYKSFVFCRSILVFVDHLSF